MTKKFTLHKLFLKNNSGERLNIENEVISVSDKKLIEANKMALDYAILTNADLSNLDFSGALARGADFRFTNLTNANFEGADLSGANFAGANLTNANFKGANLRNAHFKNAFFGEVFKIYE
jgi:uncharacterized protein YjbI with pentapeptide repeats